MSPHSCTLTVSAILRCPLPLIVLVSEPRNREWIPIVAERDGESKDYVDGEIAQAKNALVGVGARILFYQTIVHNLIRNKVEAQFHWWDEVDLHT